MGTTQDSLGGLVSSQGPYEREGEDQKQKQEMLTPTSHCRAPGLEDTPLPTEETLPPAVGRSRNLATASKS